MSVRAIADRWVDIRDIRQCQVPFTVPPQVAGGFRRPLPERWPLELRQLLTECMAQDARDRPSAEEVRPCLLRKRAIILAARRHRPGPTALLIDNQYLHAQRA